MRFAVFFHVFMLSLKVNSIAIFNFHWELLYIVDMSECKKGSFWEVKVPKTSAAATFSGDLYIFAKYAPVFSNRFFPTTLASHRHCHVRTYVQMRSFNFSSFLLARCAPLRSNIFGRLLYSFCIDLCKSLCKSLKRSWGNTLEPQQARWLAAERDHQREHIRTRWPFRGPLWISMASSCVNTLVRATSPTGGLIQRHPEVRRFLSSSRDRLRNIIFKVWIISGSGWDQEATPEHQLEEPRVSSWGNTEDGGDTLSVELPLALEEHVERHPTPPHPCVTWHIFNVAWRMCASASERALAWHHGSAQVRGRDYPTPPHPKEHI